MKINNRYQIHGNPLGEGGMGVVYLVEDGLKNNQLMALKVIRKEDLGERSLQQFKYEFAALSQLSHPNLVGVHDFGMVNRVEGETEGAEELVNQYYYTMEYIPGEDLTAFAAAGREKSQKIDDGWLLDIIVQVCRALKYIHSRGLIHYDVKPGNIRVMPDGQVKLMDFGLIGEAAHSGLSPARGTLDYAAPELFQGSTPDQRVDLYSLGVSLYEVLTGAFPFTWEEQPMQGRVRMQLSHDALKNALHDLPPGYADLIIRLLSPTPARRFARAEQVIQAINQFSAKKYSVDTGESRSGLIQSAAFVGREFEVSRLQHLLTGSIQGHGGVVLIGGPSGIGKMRLARELKIRAQIQRALVCETTCTPQGNTRLAPWIDVFYLLLTHFEGAQTPVLAEYRLFLQQLAADDLSSSDRDPSIKRLSDYSTTETAEILQQALRFILACDLPLVIILDDLQFADPLTVELLDLLGQVASEHRLLICGMFRNDTANERHHLEPLLKKTRLATSQEPAAAPAAGRFELIELGPLNEVEFAQVVHSMLGVVKESETLPAVLLKRLYTLTGGNPAYLQAVMQNLVNAGLLEFDGQTWRMDLDQLELPANIQEAARRMLDTLDAETLDILQWSAVIWHSFELELLRVSSNLPAEKLVGLINKAIWSHILEDSKQGDKHYYRFSMDPLREVVYNSLAVEERTRRHRAVYTALSRLYLDEEIAELLAWQAHRAAMPEQALRYLSLAADRNSRQNANETAAELYQSALDLLQKQPELAGPEQTFDLYHKHLSCMAILGDRTRQAQDLEVMRQLALQLSDVRRQIQVVQRQADLATALGKQQDSAVAISAAVDLAHQIGDMKLEADSLTILGESYYSLGQFEKVYDCHDQALKLYIALGDQRGEANSLRRLGRMLLRSGRLEQAIANHQHALEIFRQLGDARGESEALNSLGATVTDFAQARAYHEQALSIRKSIGDREGQASSYNNLAVIYWALGLYPRAREYMEEAVAIERSMDGRSSLAYFLETLGRVYIELGLVEEAEQALQEGLSLALEINDRWAAALYNIMLSRVFLQQGRAAEAQLYSDECVRRLRQINPPELATALAAHGAVLLALGKHAEAYSATAEAVQIVERFHTSGDYPSQDVWWQHYQVLRADPKRASQTALDPESWLCLENARQALLAGIASLSDEGLRRNYLNRVKINHAIIVEWTRQAARRSDSQHKESVLPLEAGLEPERESTRWQEKLRRVLDISREMNETREIDALLDFVMDQVIELTGAERSFLVLMGEQGEMQFRVARGISIDEFDRAKAETSYTVLGSVAQSRKPILLQDALADERFGRQSSVLELNLRSVLCVPLTTRAELVGMIYADNRTVSGRFSQVDVDLMTVFANQAATAIENVRLYSELQEANRTLEHRVADRTGQLENANLILSQRAIQLEASSMVAQQAASILSMDDMLNRVVQLIQEHFGYYFVSVWLVDEIRSVVQLQAGFGRHHLDTSGEGSSIILEAPSLIAGVCRTGKRRIINDVTQAADYLSIRDLPDTLSEATLPLRIGSRILGALDIQADRLNSFGPEDMLILQTLADQVAIAIRNAQLYQAELSRRRQAESLEQAGRRLSSSLDMSEVPGRILEQLAEVVPFERGSVLVQEENILRIVAQRGFPEAQRARSLRMQIRGGDVYQQVVEAQKPLVIDDVTKVDGWTQVEWLPVNRSWLGVPLISKNRVIGMVSLTRRDAGGFAPDDVTLASTFAVQAAIALENAGLYQEIMNFNEHLERMVEQRTEELNRAYHALERLDKIKSDFINVAAHELRTPLTVIKGFAQVAYDQPAIAGDREARMLIESVLNGTNRLNEIVNSMLDVSRISSQTLSVSKEPLIPHNLVLMAVKRYDHDFKDRKISVSLQNLETLPLILGDPDLLSKVLSHLIVNAIKYTPDGGKVTITGRNTTLARESQPPVAAIEITVSDTGIGIDPANHELIFEKFFMTGQVALHSSGQTKFKGGGPGLGLAIARGIIDAHGGKIWVESLGYDERTCPGSQFHMVLPVQ